MTKKTKFKLSKTTPQAARNNDSLNLVIHNESITFKCKLILSVCPRYESNQIIGNFKFLVNLLLYAGHLFMKTIFTIKSTEDLKSQYKLGLGPTLSRLEAKKRNLHN